MKFLYITGHSANPQIWLDPFRAALKDLGELTFIENASGASEAQRLEWIRGADVLFTDWHAMPVPREIAASRGQLKYICHITGLMRYLIPRGIVAAGVHVTNWGDAAADSIAEGAFALLMALVKDIPGFVRTVRSGGWLPGPDVHIGTLAGMTIGIYGFGFIGRRFEELLRPFHPVVKVFDPYAGALPPTCRAVDSLQALFQDSEAIVIHAGLTPATRGSVTRELLALLPRNAILVNTARGGIVDQDALFAELAAGRLRAGLDVLVEPEKLPEDHAARHWENAIFTAHQVGDARALDGQPLLRMNRMHTNCIDNVRRFVRGEPLQFIMDLDRYDRST